MEMSRNLGRSDEIPAFKMAAESAVKTPSENHAALSLCLQYLLDVDNPHYYPPINSDQ
jgi:hypothetical protein